MNKELKYFSIVFTVISILSYSISILITQLNILKFGTPGFMLIYGVAGYSPAIAAFLTVKKCHNKKSDLVSFGKNIVNFKQSISMYIYVIFIPLLLWFNTYMVYRVLGENAPIFRQPIYSLIWLVPAMIIGGGLEEIGWRGYLLPKLLEKFSLVKSTLIVGIVWAIWHIPMWFVVGAPQQDFNFIPFALGCIATSFLMTPLFYKTKSIWLCILLHSVNNACFLVFTVALDANYITIISTLIMSIILFYIFTNTFRKMKSNNPV